MPFIFDRGWVRRFDSYNMSGRKPKNDKLTISSEVGLTKPIL